MENKNTSPLIEEQNIINNTPVAKRFNPQQVKKVAIAVAVPTVIFFCIIGVVKAYEASLQWYLENSLSSNVSAAKSTVDACNSSYQAILKWKEDMKIAKTGSGNPCPFSMAE